LVCSLQLCLFVGKQRSTHCWPHRCRDRPALCWRLCFLFLMWDLCSYLGDGNSAALSFAGRGLLFTKPTTQESSSFFQRCNAAHPVYRFFEKDPVCWRFFVGFWFPVFSKREQEQKGSPGFSEVCHRKTFADILPFWQVCRLFCIFVRRRGDFLQRVFRQFRTKGFVLLAFCSESLQLFYSSAVWCGQHLYGVPHDGLPFLVFEGFRVLDSQRQPSKFCQICEMDQPEEFSPVAIFFFCSEVVQTVKNDLLQALCCPNNNRLFFPMSQYNTGCAAFSSKTEHIQFSVFLQFRKFFCCTKLAVGFYLGSL